MKRARDEGGGGGGEEGSSGLEVGWSGEDFLYLKLGRCHRSQCNWAAANTRTGMCSLIQGKPARNHQQVQGTNAVLSFLRCKENEDSFY